MILHELVAYDTLRVIWWALVGLMLVGYAVMDGFSLGTAALLPFVAKTDIERRIAINSVGPVWEGNQVWLVLGGGAVFAAWPHIYAVSFSGFYLAMYAILVALILRPVAFKFRSKREGAAWRANWDRILCLGAFLAALIYGVAMGNVLQGAPFSLGPDMRISYAGSFFDLLNPFALLAGLVSVAMLLTHGACWLQLKTDAAVARRARAWGILTAFLSAGLYVQAGIKLASVQGYHITSSIASNGPSNPLLKSVTVVPGAWFDNYAAHPALWVVPALGVGGALLAAIAQMARKPLLALLTNGVSIAGIVVSVGVSMFPFMLPSTLQPNASLTVWDSSSSHLTLFIIMVGSAIFLPLILAYTSWVYSVLRGKVDPDAIRDENNHAY